MGTARQNRKMASFAANSLANLFLRFRRPVAGEVEADDRPKLEKSHEHIFVVYIHTYNYLAYTNYDKLLVCSITCYNIHVDGFANYTTVCYFKFAAIYCALSSAITLY